MMKVIHRNNLVTYLSDVQMLLEQLESATLGKYKPIHIPKPLVALSDHTHDLSTMLGYLDSKLTILESTVSQTELDYQAYADAIVFLKSTYFFFRVLLDDLAGTIEALHKKHEKINLPPSFNVLLKKHKNGELPEDLSQVLEQAQGWFPTVKDRRDELVHKYESLLILYGKDEDGSLILEHANKEIGDKSQIFGPIREQIGGFLAEYQRLVDNMLDYFDAKSKDWHGVVFSKGIRSQTIMMGNGGIMLFWAHKYGGYCHTDLIIED